MKCWGMGLHSHHPSRLLHISRVNIALTFTTALYGSKILREKKLPGTDPGLHSYLHKLLQVPSAFVLIPWMFVNLSPDWRLKKKTRTKNPRPQLSPLPTNNLTLEQKTFCNNGRRAQKIFMTGWQHAAMQYGVGYAGFLAVPALAESRVLATKMLQTMRKSLSLVMLAGKAELSLVAGRKQAKSSSVFVLGTGPAALG